MSQSLHYPDSPGGAYIQDYYEDDDGPYNEPRNELEFDHPEQALQENSDDKSPSPRAVLLSNASNTNLNGDLGVRERSRRSSRRDSTRRGATHRELLKLFVNEEYETKQHRRVLSAALDRLDAETVRAQEAERRALELAQRFKTVNDARMAALQEASRARDELMSYKVQLENALREISRGSDLIQDMEAQRNEAEAAAARNRTKLRQIREQQLVNLAREEGRRRGYEEGLKRGYEESKVGYPGQEYDATRGLDTDQTLLDELPADVLVNFPSHSQNDVPLVPSVDEDRELGLPPSFSGGAQGSRFRENMTSPGASTISVPPSMNPGMTHWRAEPPVPMDGFIPSLAEGGYMNVPAPHNLGSQPPASPHTPSSPLPSMATFNPAPVGPPLRVPSEPVVRDYAYGPVRASPMSVADSLPSSFQSTAISQFDIVSSPRRRPPALSAIQESSMEYSPSPKARVRSDMPEPVTFPVPGTAIPNSPRSRPRREEPAPAAYNYKNFSGVEEWRHSTSSPSSPARLRSTSSLGRESSPLARDYSPGEPLRHSRSRSMHTPSNAGSSQHEGRSHRRVVSGGVPTITIESPSGHGSNPSPRSAMQSGMLSPMSSSQQLPPQSAPQTTPVRPGSRPSGPSPSVAVSELPPGFIPSSAHGPVPPYQSFDEPPSRGSPRLPMHSLYSGPSADTTALPIPQRTPASFDTGGRPPRNYGNDAFGRPHTPGRPSSAMGGTAPSRPITPSHPLYAPVRSTTPGNGDRTTSPRGMHRRSASLNATAGATPATLARPLAGAQPLRHEPSTISVASAMSGRSSSYQHYDRRSDLDPAFLAGAEDLAAIQSPRTMAITRANAAVMERRPSSGLSYESRH